MFSQSPKCAGTLTQPRYLHVLEDGVPDGENAIVAISAAAITIMSVSTIGAVNAIHLFYSIRTISAVCPIFSI